MCSDTITAFSYLVAPLLLYLHTVIPPLEDALRVGPYRIDRRGFFVVTVIKQLKSDG